MGRIGHTDDLRNALGSIDSDDLQVDIKTKAVNRAVTTAIGPQAFNNVTTTVTSDAIDLNSYREFLLLLALVVNGTPTDILIEVLMSDDNTTYYTYMRGPFGDLRYEDSAGNKNEALGAKAVARYMKIRATATGTDVANTFILTAKVAQVD